jgi:hypothetical protein
MKIQLNKVMALVFAASFSGAGSMPLANSTGSSALNNPVYDFTLLCMVGALSQKRIMTSGGTCNHGYCPR